MDTIIYCICFGVGLVFAVATAFMGHMFGGHDMDASAHPDVGTGGHAEAGYQDTGMPGLSPFSPTTITCFITAFGAFGMIFHIIPATSSPWVSAPLAILCALLTAAGVMALFGWVFHKTQCSSESRVGTLVGMTATIITPIPVSGVDDGGPGARRARRPGQQRPDGENRPHRRLPILRRPGLISRMP